MESNANRNFYKSKDGDIKIRIRASNDNAVRILNLCKVVTNNLMITKSFKFAMKPKLGADSEHVVASNFFEMPYDNTDGKDRNCKHAVIICKTHDDVAFILDELSKICDNSGLSAFHKKVNAKSYTINVDIPVQTRGIWTGKCIEADVKYPICVISFKRANDSAGLTHKTLSRIGVKHFIFCEPFEFDAYKTWANPEFATIISSGEDFSVTKKFGSTPMRNHALEWGRGNGYERIWMLDDNLMNYLRYHSACKNPIESTDVFTSIESYVDRHSNVGIACHNFAPLTRENENREIIVRNGKCYSSLLLATDPEIRFRHLHQEDNLISIENIQRGKSNLCFNHIQYSKHMSGVDKGGNREEIYKCIGKAVDGNGYRERYEYFEKALQTLHDAGELPLKPEFKSQGVSAFLSRSTTMASKEYHADCKYTKFIQPNVVCERKLEVQSNGEGLVFSQSSPSSEKIERVEKRRIIVAKECCSIGGDSSDGCVNCGVLLDRIAELEAKLAAIMGIIAK